MTTHSLQNISLILINSEDLRFRHALNKEMLLLKNNKAMFKKALEKLVIMCDMFQKWKTEEMRGSLILMPDNTC